MSELLEQYLIRKKRSAKSKCKYLKCYYDYVLDFKPAYYHYTYTLCDKFWARARFFFECALGKYWNLLFSKLWPKEPLTSKIQIRTWRTPAIGRVFFAPGDVLDTLFWVNNCFFARAKTFFFQPKIVFFEKCRECQKIMVVYSNTFS